MLAHRSVSVEQCRNATHFQSLREVLLADGYSKLLAKPLAYWALPRDRRLPLALLGWTLSDLLQTPFDEIAATPGIGQKKIGSLMTLLGRVVDTDPTDVPSGEQDEALRERAALHRADAGNGFDPAGVSEVVWTEWRASVLSHGLGKEILGRLAPSLRHLNRANWDSPLEQYATHSLEEIRSMKTHGEKRVRGILEVFYYVHRTVSQMGNPPHLAVRLTPRLVDQVEQWVARWLRTPGLPDEREVSEEFVGPLVEQIRADATPQVVRVIENRLGLSGPITSVRETARRMDLTRARVYQLLDDASDIMNVRSPGGRSLVYALQDRFLGQLPDGRGASNFDRFAAAVELFYPQSRHAIGAPLEWPLGEASPAECAAVTV